MAREYKYKINPRTGQFNLVPTNIVLSFKEAVATQGDLPLTGNAKGDARLANDDGHLWVWSIEDATGDLSDWVDAGDVVDLEWDAIAGKPSLVEKATANISYYVDCDNGSDSNPGTDAEPFETIQKAVDSLPKFLGAYYALIYLKDSQNYQEKVTISGFFGGLLSIRSQSNDADAVLISSKPGEYSIFEVSYCTSVFYPKYISMRATENYVSCIRMNYHCNGWIFKCKFGDNGNTGTYGVYANTNSMVYQYQNEDIDSNKVARGTYVTSNTVCVKRDSNFGDDENRVSGGGLVIPYDGLDLTRFLFRNHKNYYVDCDNGDDSNSGTSGSPFQTIQKAVDTVADAHLCQDVNIHLKTSQNYSEDVLILQKITHLLTIKSETGDPDDVKITLVSGHSQIFTVQKCIGLICFEGLTLVANEDNTSCIQIYTGHVNIGNCKFGGSSDTGHWTSAVNCQSNSTVAIGSCGNISPKLKYGISAGGASHGRIDSGSDISINQGTDRIVVDQHDASQTELRETVEYRHQKPQTGSVDPTGITPDYIGQTYVNDSPASGHSGIFIAYGTGVGEWRELL